MTESIQTTRTMDLARPTAPTHVDRTTTCSRRSLVLDRTPPSTPPNVISGQGQPPFQQYQEEANDVGESTFTPNNAAHYTGKSPGGTRLRNLFKITTRHRSTSSLSSQTSSGPARSIEIAHWTNGLVLYTPVPASRPKQPRPLTTLSVDTELRPPLSTIHDPTNVPEDDISSSRSTSSDSDSQMDTLSSESMSVMDRPAAWVSSNGWSPNDGSFFGNPGVQFPDPPQRRYKFLAIVSGPFRKTRFLSTINGPFRKTEQGLEPAAPAYAQPSVVAGTPETRSQPQEYIYVRDPCECDSLATTSQYGAGFLCCRYQNNS